MVLLEDSDALVARRADATPATTTGGDEVTAPSSSRASSATCSFGSGSGSGAGAGSFVADMVDLLRNADLLAYDFTL